jgi:hypothetical protein
MDKYSTTPFEHIRLRHISDLTKDSIRMSPTTWSEANAIFGKLCQPSEIRR